ncbi:MAG TPA: site-specific DNA-methyltransferase [Thermoplasmata archaeon]|nr:site-specific DNA-methyltransferase [Thermoplasmata archaeon]
MVVPATGPTLRLFHGDARQLDRIASGSVHLVVTSPPYPMIPQWDQLFRSFGAREYSEMHAILADAWRECFRVLVPGGILAVNIGDALRSGSGGFQVWPNHAETLASARSVGFVSLPYILWKKPFNKPNAFLGSGFEPPNAYVTLDCEFILLFRKGGLRRFPRHDPGRSESRFSRAERDRWFSQVWTDIRGTSQRSARGRSGAFPQAIPERLIRMFSVIGDTVLDPFAGTGTTLWAAMELRRNALGVEWDRAAYRALRESAVTRGLLPQAETRRR